MNIAGNVVGGFTQGKLSVATPRTGRRREARDLVQAVDNLDKNPSLLLEDALELALFSRELVYKEQVAALLFDKHLVAQFQDKLSQLFDGVSRDVEKNRRRLARTAPSYVQVEESFKQKIQGIAFGYLSRINHEMTRSAQSEPVNTVLNKACQVYDAIDQSYTVTTQELSTLGIANEDMLHTFSATQRSMENEVVETAAHILDKDMARTHAFEKTAADSKKIKQQYQLDDHRFIGRVLQCIVKSRSQRQGSQTFYKTQGLKNIAEVAMQPQEGAAITLFLLNEFDVPQIENYFRATFKLDQVWSAQRHRHVNVLAGLRGRVSDDETAAIMILLEKFMLLEDRYFNERVRYSYSKALDNGYDQEEIIAFAFDPHRKVHKRNLSEYQRIAQSDDVDVRYDENLYQIEFFAKELADMMLLCQQFGIQESDLFVEKVLLSLLAFDKRKDDDFYQSSLADDVVVNHLRGAIRALF